MSKRSSFLWYAHIFCLVWLHVGTRDFEDEPEMWGSTVQIIKIISAGKTGFTGRLCLRNIAEEGNRCIEQERTW